MATPSPHGLRPAPLRALLLALLFLSIIILLTLHLPTRHRPLPPAPLMILPTPLRTQRAEKADLSSSSLSPSPATMSHAVFDIDSSSSSFPSPTTMSHVVFGIASSGRTLPKRLPLLRTWLRPPARAFLYLDALPRATSPLPSNIHLRVSRDASRFPYTHRRGLPSAVRVARIAKELLLEVDLRQHGSPRWLVLGDDDTAFVLPNLLHTLSKYDWHEPWYIGARSESVAQNALHAFAMAFGGGGIAISWPFAQRLARVLDSCIIRYPHLYGSDGRIYACLAELGIELTHEPGFHQIDLRGDISGLLRAHPLAPLVSLHHLDHVYPLYPGMDRSNAVEHFFGAANADPARILQQTVCYDRSRALTASVAWGYSVQVFKGNVPLLDLLSVQKTFVPWRSRRNVTVTDAFMFNTKHYPRDECKRAALFFMKSISSGEGKTESNYSRQLPAKCSPNLIPFGNLQQIRVTSELLHLVPGKASRRHCCDIVPSSSEITMDINIRKCKDDELIAMHS
uniref:Uncharacterized protein n=1 Tax=Avena sativa TaxID=4498 RepID=A0ACD6AG84_AVESA